MWLKFICSFCPNRRRDIHGVLNDLVLTWSVWSNPDYWQLMKSLQIIMGNIILNNEIDLLSMSLVHMISCRTKEYLITYLRTIFYQSSAVTLDDILFWLFKSIKPHDINNLPCGRLLEIVYMFIKRW